MMRALDAPLVAVAPLSLTFANMISSHSGLMRLFTIGAGCGRLAELEKAGAVAVCDSPGTAAQIFGLP